MKRHIGFTLLELLCVVACIVVIVSILVYAIVGAQERSRIAVCATNLRSVHQALSGYAIDYTNWYPLHGAIDQNSIGADNPVFTGGSGYWFGDAEHPATNDYNAPRAIQNLRVKYQGIGQGLVNGGSYINQGKFRPGNVYLSRWNVLYCPNQLETTYFVGKRQTFNKPDPVAPYDSATETEISSGSISSLTIGSYYLMQPSERYASEMPEIGYSATNGNSPGYPDPAGTNNKMHRYQGKYVYYPGTNTIFNGKDSSGWNNERFAAGFLTDPPTTIILADIALLTDAGSAVKVEIGKAARSDFLEVSHDDGINTLYNDGRVGYMKFGSDTIPKSRIYYGNSKGATVFGPR